MIKYLHHLFFPRVSNNHRSKVLHIDSLIITIAILIFSSFFLSSLQKEYPAVLGISYTITPIDLLNTTNQIRQEHGLSQLKLDSELSQAASNKASDMFAKNYWAHIAPDGVTPWVFIKNSGYDYLYAGENLGRGFSGASEVVNAWMASPSHRDNMLSPNYNDVGFAIATGALTGSDTILVVEMFGSRYGPKQIAKSSTNNSVIPVKEESTTPVVSIISTNTPQPSQTILSPAPLSTLNSSTQVAAIQQQPLIDKNNFTKNIAIAILVFFIVVLTIDAIIIEKKKIIRVVSHNLDHIIYLIIILLTILVIGRGLVL